MRTQTYLDDYLEQRGFEVITDAIAHNMPANSKPFIAIQTITTTVIANLSTEVSSPITGNALSGLTIPPNAIIYGRFTSITLTSGTCIAYKGV